MNPEERIDNALDFILRAGGLSLNAYTHHSSSQERLADMRAAMKKIMSDSYIQGSNDNFNAMQNSTADHIAESRAKSRISTLSKARKIKVGEL